MDEIPNAGPYRYALRTGQGPKKVVAANAEHATDQADGAAQSSVEAVAATEQVREPDPQSDLFLKANAAVGNVVALKRKGLPDSMRVFNAAFVEDLDIENLPGSSGSVLRTKGGVNHNVDWLIAEEIFFSPKIARVNLSSSALICGEGAAGAYSVPLTTTFFKYFPDSGIKGMLKVAVEGVGEQAAISAMLELPLRPSQEGQSAQTLNVQKSYTEVVDLTLSGTSWSTTPAFGIWPDFISPSWTHNFAVFIGPHQSNHPMFSVRPLLKDENPSNPPPATVVDGSDNELRIWRCIKPPIGFALESDHRPAGLVLRRPTPHLPVPIDGKTWTVSVDFGTANSMITYKSSVTNQTEPEGSPLQLNGRLVILNSGLAAQMSRLANAVYPREGTKSPFRALLYSVDATVHDIDGQPYSLGFEFLPVDAGSLVRDLKWGGDAGPMKAYLTGLVRYIACEATANRVEKLILKWSYPLALPGNLRAEMDRFWKADATGYSSGADLIVEVGQLLEDQTTEKSVSESEATCRALAYHPSKIVPVTADGLCIAIDVGGGSTDFAYWSKGNLLDQFSFKLAGNDVLRGDLKSLDSYLPGMMYAALGKAPSPADQELFSRIEGNQVEMWVNHILSQAIFEDTTKFEDLPDKDKKRRHPLFHPAVQRIIKKEGESPWKEIRTLGFLLFGGISYYAGLHSSNFEITNNAVTVFVSVGEELIF